MQRGFSKLVLRVFIGFILLVLVSLSVSAYCGDDDCNGPETCVTCPVDCGNCECRPGDSQTDDCGKCGWRWRDCLPWGEWDDWSHCVDQGSCWPGDWDSRNCGNCGRQDRQCGSNCEWRSWGSCYDQGCRPGDRQVKDCNKCGYKERFCNNQCGWGSWSNCKDQGDCNPGDSYWYPCGWCGRRLTTCNDQCSWVPGQCQDEGDCGPGSSESRTCGNCGHQSRICSNQCLWGNWGACQDQGCTPGSTQTQACGNCGERTRTCNNQCEWGQWGTCTGQGCAPGSMQTRECGNCGEQSRTCDDTCQWDPWGICFGQGCAPGSTQTRECNTGIPGICAEGDQSRSCSQQCSWGNWGECNPLLPPETEICDTLDNDCDGEIDEVCSTCMGDTIPDVMGPGETRSVSVTFRNDGNIIWMYNIFRLRSTRPNFNNLWGISAVTMIPGVTVGQGEQYSFNFDITAPTEPGTYDCFWRMIRAIPEWYWLDDECGDDVVVGECRPGDLDSRPCGNCGTQERLCLPDGTWGQWGLCYGQGVCDPSDEEERQCGNCGLQTRDCNDQCQWDPWGECTGEGSCTPGTTEDEECGDCGLRTRICGDTCEWDNWGQCLGEGECSAGDVINESCGNCGFRERICGDLCIWDPWGQCQDEGVCAPGDNEERDCGNCGTQERVCGDTCDWDSWGECTDEGSCAPGDSDNEDCGDCGTRERICGDTCEWDDWGNCEDEGDCTPGSSYWEECGNCGQRFIECNVLCEYVFGACTGEGSCEPGDTQSESCGECGTRERVCGDSCEWDDWGQCSGEGSCAPGDSESQDCGNCGQQSRICGDTCEWNDWGQCTGEGPCAPGDSDDQDCGDCGSQSRLCSAFCQWNDWGECSGEGECTPGSLDSRECGNCGYQIRICLDICGWDLWGQCQDEGECAPGDEEERECDTGELGICAEGEQSRECSNGCNWDSWSTCEPIYESEQELCDNLDNDCDGEIDEECFTCVDDTIPSTMAPGQTTEVTVTVRNDGSEDWTSDDLYRLGSRNPEDNVIWGLNRVEIEEGVIVSEGEQYIFTYDITAPTTVGTYANEWRMLKEGAYWFLPPNCGHDVVISGVCTPGDTEEQECGNCGTQERVCESDGEWGSWGQCTDEGVCSPGDSELQGCDTGELGICSEGEQSRLCTSQCQWDQWGECYQYNFPVEEECDDLDNDCDGNTDENCYTCIDDTIPNSMETGESLEVTVTVRNDGSVAWTRNDLYRLGSRNPADNTRWGLNRVFIDQGDVVSEGEEYTFTFNINAPNSAGTYANEWRMIKEGDYWFLPPNCGHDVEVDEEQECTPGDEDQEPCGNCGIRIRECLSNGHWGSWGSCGNEGVCSPGSNEDRSCGTNIGECSVGIETRTCTSSCQWGDYEDCTGIGPEQEICDDLDNDCDGSVDEGVCEPDCEMKRMSLRGSGGEIEYIGQYDEFIESHIGYSGWITTLNDGDHYGILSLDVQATLPNGDPLRLRLKGKVVDVNEKTCEILDVNNVFWSLATLKVGSNPPLSIDFDSIRYIWDRENDLLDISGVGDYIDFSVVDIEVRCLNCR
ncbi:NBR1-Ig-like domain-containing protein [Nanoarchaeota archaeon]